MPISEVDVLTRELLEKLRARNVELKDEMARNLEVINVLERRVNLAPMEESAEAFVSTPEIYQSSDTRRPGTRFTFKRDAFLGLKLKQAVIALLGAAGTPMGINDILEILEASGYQFKVRSPHRVLGRVLSEAPEVQKQGTLFLLKDWNGNPPSPNGKTVENFVESDQEENEDSDDAD
jgi:hypothetical protein